ATCSDEAFELTALGVPSGRIAIAPCGVDLEAFTASGPVVDRGRAKRIVSIGRLVPRKGFDTIIDALAEMGDDTVELLIVGGPGDARVTAEDPEGQRLLARARERGVSDQVVLTGDRKSTRLNSSHVSISYAVFCL